MTENASQVSWTDEQWARVNQIVQEEASRARVAASFLPLIGPLSASTDFVRRQVISYSESGAVRTAARNEVNAAFRDFNAALAARDFANAAAAQQRIATAQVVLERRRLGIDDRETIQLATLQVMVPVRGAQMADPEMTSVLSLFRRAANVLARLEDAVVFRGLARDPVVPGRLRPPRGAFGPQNIWEITGGEQMDGLWTTAAHRQWIRVRALPTRERGQRLVRAVSRAVGLLESRGQFGPFAVVLGQNLFLVAQTPDRNSLVLPQDRIIPFLGGGSLLRSSTLNALNGFSGVVVALGGAPVELVIATDVCVQFLQLTAEPVFLFRVFEKMVLCIKEPEAIVQLYLR
jgi:uncharacterized linocin/CFP29 family protein